MDDIQAPPVGTVGTVGIVECIDDIGQIHVKWENGCGLALVPECDKFKVLETKHLQKR